MTALLHWQSAPPSLRRPVLVTALDGFVDAGGSAATAATFLQHRWRARELARFSGDELIDYRARRPTAVVDAGELRSLEWPEIVLLHGETGAEHEVLLLVGPEPDMAWERFCAELTEVSARLGVELAVSLGAYPAAVPHTRSPRVLKAVNAPAVGAGLAPEVLDIAGYTGPVGATVTLQHALADHGVPAVGLWAEVPHYIASSPNPAGALALVGAATGLLGVELDTTELEAAARQHREQVDAAVAEHPEAEEMVATLERQLDEDAAADRLPSGEDLAVEIERFLRAEGD